MSDGGFQLLSQLDSPQLDRKILWISGEEEARERNCLHGHPGLAFTIVHSLKEAATFLEADDFDAILASVLRLFEDFDATVWLVRGEELVAVARGGPTSPGGLDSRPIRDGGFNAAGEPVLHLRHH